MKCPRARNIDYHGESILQWIEERESDGTMPILLRPRVDDNEGSDDDEFDIVIVDSMALDGEDDDKLEMLEFDSQQDSDMDGSVVVMYESDDAASMVFDDEPDAMDDDDDESMTMVRDFVWT